jgi:signal transduction histidine kinase
MMTPVRSRASLVLLSVALAQLILMAGSLVFLHLRFNSIQDDLTLRGREEQSFLKELADAETDLYRSSILLRDNIIMSGAEQQRARNELADLLTKTSQRPLQSPEWVPREMRLQLAAVEADRRGYLARARTVLDWQEPDRKALGARYLSEQLAPTRARFVATSREIANLVRSLRVTRENAMADSIRQIQALLLRISAGAACLSMMLAGLAVWRFRHYESERERHVRNLGEAQEGLRALSQRLVDSQETERRNLSRELHDEVGQTLTALRVQLGQVAPAQEASAEHLRLAAELAERSLRSVREMARGLRPAMLDDLGLASALTWLGRDFSRNTDLDVNVEIEGETSLDETSLDETSRDETSLDETRRVCLYRIVQEALTNCVRHSGSGTARVVLHENPGEVVLTVQDNGKGFTQGDAKGIGLLGMRERVKELNGEFGVISTPGSGTLIRVRLPKGRLNR